MRPSSSFALACLSLFAAACSSSNDNRPECGASCGSAQDATTAPTDSSSAEASATSDATEGTDAADIEEAGTESGTPDASSGDAGEADGGDAGAETDAADGGHADASVDAGSDAGPRPACLVPSTDCASTGTACIVAYCDGGVCAKDNATKSTPCSEGGGNICSGAGYCTTSCSDGTQDATETATDCGGAYCDGQGKTCAVGQACLVGADCNPYTSGVCGANKKCVAATCADGVRNNGETGVDCGGPCAALTPTQVCRPGDPCGTASDCQSGICTSGSQCGALRPNGQQCNYLDPAPGCASNYCNGLGNCAACTTPGNCLSGNCSDAGVCGM